MDTTALRKILSKSFLMRRNISRSKHCNVCQQKLSQTKTKIIGRPTTSEDQQSQLTWLSKSTHRLSHQTGSIPELVWGVWYTYNRGQPGLASVKEDLPNPKEIWGPRDWERSVGGGGGTSSWRQREKDWDEEVWGEAMTALSKNNSDKKFIRRNILYLY